MKTIRVEFDDAMLERLDRHPAVRERGRSAVLREAVGAYLQEAGTEDIAGRYQSGYRSTPAIDDELEDWANQAVWPGD